MKMLNKKTVEELEKIFRGFQQDVTVKYFGKNKANEDRFCRETRELLEGVSQLTQKVNLDIYDFDADAAAVEEFDIKRIPATVVMDETDYGIRFYGIPSGYEFSSFIESLKLIASGENMLVQETRDFLDSLDKDVHLQVFVTPTCPHCPGAVALAHRMAYYCPKVKGDMIEATEFPELAQKYEVMGVPRTIINESGFQEGSVPEDILLEKIKGTIT